MTDFDAILERNDLDIHDIDGARYYVNEHGSHIRAVVLALEHLADQSMLRQNAGLTMEAWSNTVEIRAILDALLAGTR